MSASTLNLAKAVGSLAGTLERLTRASENVLRHAPHDLYDRAYYGEDAPPMWLLELQAVVAIAREALAQEDARFRAALITEARK